METLKFLLQSKKAETTESHDVVENAVLWLRGQFGNADVAFHFSDGGVGRGVYGYFQIKSLVKEQAITLHLKIAEINAEPYAFTEIRVSSQDEGVLFPFFCQIGSEEGKILILHYIADFLLSTTPDLTAK